MRMGISAEVEWKNLDKLSYMVFVPHSITVIHQLTLQHAF